MSEAPDGLVFRPDGLRLRSLDASKRFALFVASDESLDSHDEILEQNWKLDRYHKNPVVLFGHDQSQLPIGRGNAGVVNNELQIGVEFAPPELNPFAGQVFGMLEAGFLKAVSVGFRPGKLRREKRGDRDVWVLSENELYELSVVPIGSNPNALGKGPDPLLRMKAAFNSALSAPVTEKTMTEAADKGAAELVELRGKIDTESKAHAETAKKLAEVTAAKAEVEAKLAISEKRVSELEAEALTAHVTDLVGKKITAAEFDSQLAIARLDRKAFDAAMAVRPDLNLKGSIVAAGPDDKSKTVGGSTNGEELAALVG